MHTGIGKGLKRGVVAVAASLTVLACGTPKVLPPRMAPARTMPVVTFPAEPPAAGHGRLVIDSVDGPMEVAAQNLERFEGAASRPSRTGKLCTTPCVVDLPLGRYRLYLSGLASDPGRGDAVEVEVRQGVNVLRRAPGKYETPEYLPAVPILLMVGGGLGIGLGSALAGSGDGTSGGVLIGGGVALTIGGAVTWPHRAIQQDGASTYWNVAPLPEATDIAAPPVPPPPGAAPTAPAGASDTPAPAPPGAGTTAAPPTAPPSAPTAQPEPARPTP